jgi:hypothetical protein
MSVGVAYRIEGEGEGGDYDVLALNDAHELFYFECKSGSVLKKADFENFFKRHQFLRPAMSVMVFDETRSVVKEKLRLMRQVLTDDARRGDPVVAQTPDYQYSDFKPIPAPDREYAYHINRNLFFCSGEKISRAIAHCLRYYEGVVKQSSYWS